MARHTRFNSFVSRNTHEPFPRKVQRFVHILDYQKEHSDLTIIFVSNALWLLETIDRKKTVFLNHI